MHDPVSVGVGQRVRNLSGDPDRLVHRQLLFAIQAFPEGLTLNVRHRDLER